MASKIPTTDWRMRLAWTLQIALALVFLMTAYRKFTGYPEAVATIEALGTGQWLRILIGVFELAGAIGLLFPRLAIPAASGLALLMVGATCTHLFFVPGSVAPALVLLAAYLSALVLRVWRER